MAQHQAPGRPQEKIPQRAGTIARTNSSIQPFDDLLEYAKTYAREKPETFALACFGVGFILGWRLKPW